MERRTALVASIATGVSLTIGVVAYAATGGASILGLGGPHRAGSGRAADPLVVHQVQTIEDEIVVSSRSTDAPRPVEREGTTASDTASKPAGAGIDDITVSIGPSATAAIVVAPAVPPGITPTSSTTATPALAPTTVARPLGVPADWPANEPIPPMPADCRQPQLEDNGVWNCDH